ncbi:MAG: hypothetical protein FJ107_04755 [Deltaproteobacteria bacterium]|nr:hypothetical protein [Deltaproteobacteria bacterium]
MTDTSFLGKLRALLGDPGGDVIYPCIQDLVENGLTVARFSPADPIPTRQDVTQYLASWCRHAGLSQEDCLAWLAEYSVAMLSSISRTSPSGIRGSTKSNLKHIYRADIPFICECDENPFRAHCSANCPVYADMQVKLLERKSKKPDIEHVIERPAEIFEMQKVSVRETYKEQFEAALEVIRGEMERGTERKAILDLLIERGFKTRTGKRWTYSILGNEQSRIRQGPLVESLPVRQAGSLRLERSADNMTKESKEGNP